MNLLMISGDRSMLSGKQGAFWYTLEAFSKHWGRIDVICPKVPHSPLPTTHFFENVFFHPSPYSLWKQPQWIVERGRQILPLHRHSVMTVHDYPPFYNGRGARKLSKETGIPHVLEIHHIVGYPVAASFQERIGALMSRAFLPSMIDTSAACRVVNKGTAETLKKWGAPSHKLHVVPSFYLDRAMIESIGEVPSHYDVVFGGRLVANKGADRLIQAIARLPKATLLIIGDGPEQKALQTLAKSLGITHRVEFKGWLPTQRDVLKTVKSAKVLVMNSTSEGGPRMPLEAMACGVPVIVTKVGIMPDVVVDGMNGLFTTGTPEDLSVKIEEIINHPEKREKMGNEARGVLDRFEREKLIEKYARFLQSCA